jgi:hypothetical protein
MIPFYEAYSPAQMARATMLDTVWCIGWVIGFALALWQHFTQSDEDAIWGRLFDALPTIARDEDLTPEQRRAFWQDTRLSSTVTISHRATAA